jgi:hypothetical protein
MHRHLLSIFIGTVSAIIVGGMSGTQVALFPIIFLILGDSRDGFGLTDFVFLLGLYGGALIGVLVVFWFQLRTYPYGKRAVTQLGGLVVLQVGCIRFFTTSTLDTTGVLVVSGSMAVASAMLLAAFYYRRHVQPLNTPG